MNHATAAILVVIPVHLVATVRSSVYLSLSPKRALSPPLVLAAHARRRRLGLQDRDIEFFDGAGRRWASSAFSKTLVCCKIAE
ncbi:hypothetical protein PIB30_078387 [Stylosanthes scabra]|uniref:Secreted protein n=1 Tax=Stylosanthes scabra TaxID=79078 RepID=A0ABU6WP55_9FABA|nr:hypothetical protein [Stylosanthes scabra]